MWQPCYVAAAAAANVPNIEPRGKEEARKADDGEQGEEYINRCVRKRRQEDKIRECLMPVFLVRKRK